MASLEFSAVIKILGVNPYVLVSKSRSERLKSGWRKPMPVLVRVNGSPDKAWRINMMPVGDGSFYLYLHGNVRQASATKVGDKVNVEVSFDARYKPGPTDYALEWFIDVLQDNPLALQNWDKLSPSRQKEILRYLGNLKSAAARDRNTRKVLGVLSGQKLRYMGRQWHDGA